MPPRCAERRKKSNGIGYEYAWRGWGDHARTAQGRLPPLHPIIQSSNHPTIHSSIQSSQPSKHPTIQSSNHPSNHPTIQPSIQSSNHPAIQPSGHPIIQSSSHPTIQSSCCRVSMNTWKRPGRPSTSSFPAP